MAATRRGDVTLPCRCGFFHLPPCRFRPACRLRRRSGREGGVALFLAAVAFVVTVTACTAVAAPTAATTAPSMPSLVTAAVDSGGADTVIDDVDLPPITAAFRGHLFGSPSAHDEAVAMGLDPSGNLYLAGTTTPHGGGGTPWGTLLPGYTGGGADFWVAKLSPATALMWVRRAGSAAGETAAAMAVGRTGVVVCGSTGGGMRASGGRVVGAAGGGVFEDAQGGAGGRITGADDGDGRTAGADGGGGLVTGAEGSGGRITGADGGSGRTGAFENGAEAGAFVGRATPTEGAVDSGGGGSLPTLPELLVTATGGGSATPAAPDAVLVKLAPDGTEAWASALQIGGAGADDCRALAMDADAGWVWAAGSTASMLFSRTSGASALGDAPPPAGRSNYWVAKAASSGLLPELVAGVQRGAERANSADAIALSGDRLYVLANTYNDVFGEGRGGVAMLHIYAAATLEFLSSTAAPAPGGDGGVAAGAPASDLRGLYLTALAVDHSHAAYVGGFVGDASSGRGSYAVAKYDAGGGWAWARPHGRYSRVKPVVALAVDPSGTVVYVGGLADGFYADVASGRGGSTRGRVVAPLVELNASTGVPLRRWQKTTAIPGDAERTTAVAVDGDGAVVYAGSRLASGSMAGMRKALLGAVGSATFATRLAGGADAAGGDGGQAVHVDSSTGAADKPPDTMPLTAVVGMVAGVMGGAVVLVGAMVMGVKRRQVWAGKAETAAAEGAERTAGGEVGGGEAARAHALAAMEAVLPYPGAASAGGSAVPV